MLSLSNLGLLSSFKVLESLLDFSEIEFCFFWKDLSYDSSSDSLSSFSQGKPGSLFNGDREVKFGLNFDIVSRHSDFGVIREFDFCSSISSFEIELDYNRKVLEVCNRY